MSAPDQPIAPTLAAPVTPRLRGQTVNLRPISRGDYYFLWELRSDPEVMCRWMQSRHIPTVEQYFAELDRQVSGEATSMMLVESLQLGRPVGVLYGSNFSHIDHYAFLTVAFKEDLLDPESGIEAVFIYLNYLFSYYDLNKVNAEIYSFNAIIIQTLVMGGWEIEGTFKDHRYFAGRYWDTMRLALFRPRWYELFAQYKDLVFGQTASVTTPAAAATETSNPSTQPIDSNY